MRIALGWWLAMLAGSVTSAAQQPDPISPSPTNAQVSFAFERPGLAVPKFTLTINEDGTGRYEADQVFPASPGAPASEAPPMQHVDRPLSLSAATTAQIFTNARALDHFNAPCASSVKNIADTGRKTLRYAGVGGDGMCVYNYSQDKHVVALTEMFQAIALTLDMGRKLDFEHRFDRLGLDETIASLAEQVHAGRAMELGTIATTLNSIAQDSEVLERVRLRAAKLLK